VSTLQLCDRILVLDGGRIVAIDDPSALATDNAFYAASLGVVVEPSTPE
jgi:ABC-type multidrug transport system fused ATPase/permease subunit